MPPIKFRERLTKFMISISLSEKFCCQNLITCIKVINMTRNSAKSNKLRNTLSLFENRVPLKPVPGGGGGGGGVGNVAPLHYCTLTDSIEPSLLFSCL